MEDIKNKIRYLQSRIDLNNHQQERRMLSADIYTAEELVRYKEDTARSNSIMQAEIEELKEILHNNPEK